MRRHCLMTSFLEKVAIGLAASLFACDGHYLVRGRVTSDGATALPGVMVDVYHARTCDDTALLRGHAHSSLDGSYRVDFVESPRISDMQAIAIRFTKSGFPDRCVAVRTGPQHCAGDTFPFCWTVDAIMDTGHTIPQGVDKQ